MKFRNSGISVFLSLLALSGHLFSGCARDSHKETDTADILVEVRDSALTMRDVLSRVPAGLSAGDSAEMVKAEIDRWLRNMMLTDLAAENVADLDRIERLAEDYRNSLIIERYLRSKGDEAEKVSQEEIKAFYDAHAEEMKLKAPLIKGIYLKVSDSEERLDDIRKWMSAATPSATDNIEKYGLRHASQYEYFLDRWVDWNVVAEQIPYRFFDADAFLDSTRDFETSYGGSVYILHISGYLASGSSMPYEYAYTRIEDILDNERRNVYRNNLLGSLYAKGIRDGILKPGIYDPVKGEMKLKK